MEDIEKHIKNLKQYIKEDEIIEDKIIKNDNSDFAKFCKGHIEDIQAVLNELDNRIPREIVENKLKELEEKDYILSSRQSEISIIKELLNKE